MMNVIYFSTVQNVNPMAAVEKKGEEYVILCWNIDGLREEVWAWMKPFLELNKPHILCLNETKKPLDILNAYFNQLKDYVALISVHTPPHNHGVAILVRKDVKWNPINFELGCLTRSDNKCGDPSAGRILAIQVEGQFNIVNTYVPNSGSNVDAPLKNLGYRVNVWDPALQNLLNRLDAWKPTIWIGDINVAPTDLDATQPDPGSEAAGFTKLEKQSFNKFMESGRWVDIWREQHPTEPGYTFRGYGAAGQIRWRLDNTIISRSLKDRVTDSFTITDCWARTDHLPFGIRMLK